VPVGRQLAVVFMAIDPRERESLLRRLALLPFPMTRAGLMWKQ